MRRLIAAAAILAVVFVLGCQDTKKVTATGTVKNVAGKSEFTASKIELAK